MLVTEVDKAKLYADAFNEGYGKGRVDAFKEFVTLYQEFCKTTHGETCIKTDDECDGMCIDCFEQWVQKKEQK